MHAKILELRSLIYFCIASQSLILRCCRMYPCRQNQCSWDFPVQRRLNYGQHVISVSLPLLYPQTAVVMTQHVQAVTSNYSLRGDKVPVGYSVSLYVCIGEVCDKLAGTQGCFSLTSRVAFQLKAENILHVASYWCYSSQPATDLAIDFHSPFGLLAD